MAGVVELGVDEVLGAQGAADEEKRGAGQLGLAHGPGDGGERGVD